MKNQNKKSWKEKSKKWKGKNEKRVKWPSNENHTIIEDSLEASSSIQLESSFSSSDDSDVLLSEDKVSWIWFLEGVGLDLV
jgi:hypothetical protein